MVASGFCSGWGAFARGRGTSANSSSRNAAKILRRFGPTGRNGRSNPGSSTLRHLIMASLKTFSLRHPSKVSERRGECERWIPRRPELGNTRCMDSGRATENERRDLGRTEGVAASRSGVDFLFDELFDPLRSARVILIQIFEDGLAVGECPPRVADPHIPWRLSAAATTSSGT